MTATPTPGGITARPIPLSVGMSGEQVSISRWWRMLGGLLMTLALGTLYAWSIFVTPLENEFGWRRAQTSSVFTFAVIMFAASLLLGGKLQDRFGPFWISLTGSILVSLSFLLFAYTSSLYSPSIFSMACSAALDSDSVTGQLFQSWPSGSRTKRAWQSAWRSRDTAADRQFLGRSPTWCCFPTLAGALPA